MASMIEIINALETRLKEIKKANGYNTDIGNNVVVFPDFPIDALNASDIVDGVIAFDVPGESYTKENGFLKRVLSVSIQTGTPYESNPELKACGITEDLITALASQTIMSNVKTRLKDSEISFPASGSPNLIVVNMTAEIEYLTKFN